MHESPASSVDLPLSLEDGPTESLRLISTKPRLRIAIVSENLMPKVDGVTRCLARLLAHLREQGHEAVVLGPQSGMTHYETHPLVGTAGIPLVLYPGLKLNFLRPRFLRVIHEFNPDVIHIVEPIWLGAQVLMAMQLGWCGEEWMPTSGPGLGRGVGGAVVASYHTNLPTYATLFGLPWLEPIMWRWVRWLHRKCLLTACPSNSTAEMLRSRGIDNVRIWARGVDIELFGPHRRSAARRMAWGVKGLPDNLPKDMVLPPTPPPSPEFLPVGKVSRQISSMVVLYVGRVSYEKNLLLLIHAFNALMRDLPESIVEPKLVFVGDGPARGQMEVLCRELGITGIFEGHLSGERLAEAYASADIFAFPSYTETFGQVVLEALASGLPVVGLDAEGTRDLVVNCRTGHLLPLPDGACSWPAAMASTQSSYFAEATQKYSSLLRQTIVERALYLSMRTRALDEGIKGRTWFDAMEAMVDCYREGIHLAGAKQKVGPRRSGRCPAGPWVRMSVVVFGLSSLILFLILRVSLIYTSM